MKDYGGAFDIDPHSFWTRDDLNEFQSELEDNAEIKAKNVIIKGIYIDYNNVLEVDVEADECEYTISEKVIMRKIKKPSDLINNHLQNVVDKIVGAITE